MADGFDAGRTTHKFFRKNLFFFQIAEVISSVVDAEKMIENRQKFPQIS